MRWLIMGRAILVEMSRLRSPNRVMTLKYEGRRIDDDVINGVMSFLALYLFTFMMLTILLDMLGLDLVTASSGALTALANVGPGIGPIIGPAGNFATLTDPVKVVLTVGMYLGRLEMMTVFVLFLPLFWRELAD
jgi:trk system potassium uptake protein TrkH